MVYNLIIATLLAISIVAIFVALGLWAAARTQRQDEVYWKAYPSLSCPRCGHSYGSDSRTTRWFATCGGGDGWVFHCRTCGEDAWFKKEEKSPPSFECFESQNRHCVDCGELFVGEPNKTCPVCGTSQLRNETKSVENGGN
jgi:hypothetical protein